MKGLITALAVIFMAGMGSVGSFGPLGVMRASEAQAQAQAQTGDGDGGTFWNRLNRLMSGATDRETDGQADRRAPSADQSNSPVSSGKAAQQPADPRAGDKAFEQSRRLLAAVREILDEAAETRAGKHRLPSNKDYLFIAPPWTETREDREKRIRKLLDSALEIVTDVPIVKLQQEIASRRQNIKELEEQIATLTEKKLEAPKDAFLPGILTDTVDSLEQEIADLKTRIKNNQEQIARVKGEIHTALAKSGLETTPEQLDLMLDSVLGGDLVRLVAAYDVARSIDKRLAQLVSESQNNLKAARRYFAMHATLFAMLLHAQDTMIAKIDKVYLPRLRAIERDIKAARRDTLELLRVVRRRDQRRALRANLRSQEFASRVAAFYRDYLRTQRRQLLRARRATHRDLSIADNTFVTVEASFQLRTLIENAQSSFEAIQHMKAPGFEQFFENQELRREFENLTRKLAPTS